MHDAQWTPRRGLLVAAAALAILVLALSVARLASAAPSGAQQRSSAARSHAVAARRRRISVTLRDFTITIARRRHLHAGRVTFRVRNLGPSSHNLTVRRKGSRRTHATPTFAAGQTVTLKLRLRKGRYVFFCSVPGHAALGMKVAVRVHRHT